MLEVLLECFVQLFGDFILDALLRSSRPIANATGNVIVASLAALVFAVVSLLIHPHPFIANPHGRLAVLIVFPPLNGGLAAAVGRSFLRSGRPRSGFEHFLPACAFSLAFGLMRFAAAK